MTGNRLGRPAPPISARRPTSRSTGIPGGRRHSPPPQRRTSPVLLDIGAVWCHWCHVMDGESYEDPELAGFLNEHFVCIKVDRDERPDVDARYQRAVQALTRQGGWPLTAFLTPAGEVFYGGTYFPPDGKYGRPGFRTVLAERARRLPRPAGSGAGAGRGHPPRRWTTDLDEARPASSSPALLDDGRAPDGPGVRPGCTADSGASRSSPIPARSPCCCTGGTTQPTTRSARSSTARSQGMGAGRHLRPARRRIPPLQRGRRVDRAPLREDVVRQLRAAQGLPRRVRALRHRGVRRGGPRHRPLGARGDGRPGGRLRREPGRRRGTRRRRRLLHLDPRRGRRGADARGAGGRGGLLRHRHRRGDAPRSRQERALHRREPSPAIGQRTGRELRRPIGALLDSRRRTSCGPRGRGGPRRSWIGPATPTGTR